MTHAGLAVRMHIQGAFPHVSEHVLMKARPAKRHGCVRLPCACGRLAAVPTGSGRIPGPVRGTEYWRACTEDMYYYILRRYSRARDEEREGAREPGKAVCARLSQPVREAGRGRERDEDEGGRERERRPRVAGNWAACSCPLARAPQPARGL